MGFVHTLRASSLMPHGDTVIHAFDSISLRQTKNARSICTPFNIDCSGQSCACVLTVFYSCWPRRKRRHSFSLRCCSLSVLVRMRRTNGRQIYHRLSCSCSLLVSCRLIVCTTGAFTPFPLSLRGRVRSCLGHSLCLFLLCIVVATCGRRALSALRCYSVGLAIGSKSLVCYRTRRRGPDRCVAAFVLECIGFRSCFERVLQIEIGILVL